MKWRNSFSSELQEIYLSPLQHSPHLASLLRDAQQLCVTRLHSLNENETLMDSEAYNRAFLMPLATVSAVAIDWKKRHLLNMSRNELRLKLNSTSKIHFVPTTT